MQALAGAGVTVVADTCVVVAPILPAKGGVLMTNSGKFAHYTPANTGYQVIYGSLADCVASAATGRVAPRRGALAMSLQATTQIAGSAEGEVLKLGKPISFWGGVDPKTGRISDPRHPDYDKEIAGHYPGPAGDDRLELVELHHAGADVDPPGARRSGPGGARRDPRPRRGGGAGDELRLDPRGRAAGEANRQRSIPASARVSARTGGSRF